MKNHTTKKFWKATLAFLAVAWGTAFLGGCACMEKPKGCLSTEIVAVDKQLPAETTQGQVLAYDITVTAHRQATHVILTEKITGATFVKSEPEATVTGNELSWRFDDLHKGDTRTVRVWIKSDNANSVSSCTSVRADPQCCESIAVVSPAITISKTGPQTAKMGDQVTYNITVRNTGNTVARNVVVTDAVPAGFTEESGKSALSFNLGDLAPNESKDVQVRLKATQSGKICNTATATSSNAVEVSDEACTTIMQPGIKVTKTGDKEEYVSKTASYTVTVSNTGDTNLTNVVVTDSAPDGTSMVSAERGQINGAQAVWNITELKAGDEQSFGLVLKGQTAGTHCNQVSVSSSEGVSDRAEACTLWKGLAGLVMEVVDTIDPIKVGEASTYEIIVTNQGTADANNIAITMNFPVEITPLKASGATDGTVNGQTVTFARYPKLAAGTDGIRFKIDIKGAQAGDARPEVSLTCDQLETPVLEQESTHVY